MMSGGFEKLSQRNRDATCSFVTPSLVVIQYLQSLAMGKQLYLRGNNNNDNNNEFLFLYYIIF